MGKRPTYLLPLGFRKNGKPIYPIKGGSEPAVESGQQAPQGQQQQNVGTGQQQPQQQIEQQGNGKPYDQYLQRLPEGMRNIVAPIFDEWDGNTTRRFQELQGRITDYEPYQEIFDEWEPDAVKQGMNIAQQLSTREGALELYQQLQGIFAQEGQNGQNGQQQQNGGQQQQNQGEWDELFENPRFKQIEEGLGKISETLTQQQQSEQNRVVEQQTQKEWNAALEKNKALVSNADGSVNEDATNTVLSLAISMTEGNIDKAFEMYAKAVGKQATLQNQPGREAPVVGGGSGNNVPSTVTEVAKWTPQQRRQAALAMVKAGNQSQQG